MTKADALRTIVNDAPDTFMVSISDLIINAKDLLDIYDQLNEVIEVSVQSDPVPSCPQSEPISDCRQEMRGRREKKLDVGKMVALAKAGWPYKAIGEECGCSASTAFNRVKEVLDAERD